MSIFGVNEVSDFVVNGKADSSSNTVRVEEISRADEEEVKIIDRGRLDDPIHAGGEKLATNLEEGVEEENSEESQEENETMNDRMYQYPIIFFSG